ncbi:tetratricopeptide repeat protein [Myxococcota bacterium]|nr:tetratricopeptide repeat protein [Myxococcota bacterium]
MADDARGLADLTTRPPGRGATPIAAAAAAPREDTPRRTGPVPPERLGHYVVLERLGAGGMGVVYAAYDERLDRKVALKVLGQPDDHPHSAEDEAALLHEARALAQLSDPHVVPVYDVGRLADGALFVAMELVRGVTLRGWQKAAPRDLEALVRVYAQAGAGLAAAHRRGIVHRDFKPDNVLVGDDGRVRVVDFGIATVSSEVKGDAGHPVLANASPAGQDHDIVGTPGYWSPEQVRGATGPRADQFSFCVALYEAAYGQRPFANDAFFETKNERGPGAPPPVQRRPPPSDLRAPWLWAILERGLAIDPEARFESMDALVAELERGVAPRRRTGGVVLASVLAATIVAGAWVLADRRDPCAPPAELLAGTWDPATSQRARDALAATKSPFAADTARLAVAGLDRYAARLLAEHRAACEATHVHNVQSEELLDLRMECLAGKQRALKAASAVMIERPASAAEHIAELVAELGEPSACADTRVLRLGLTPPRDATVLASVDQIRADLATAQARLAAVDLAGAADVLTRAESTQKSLDYGPSRAELLTISGRLAIARGDVRPGIETLRTALDLAVATRHDELVADAWLLLALDAGRHHDRPEQVRDWLRHAEAALRRIDRSDDVRWIGIAHARGRLEAVEGRHADAVTTLGTALERAAKAFGADDPRTAVLLHDRAHSLAASGRAEDALADYRRALDVRMKSLGPAHPDTARTRYAIALVAIDPLARLDEAAVELDEARRVYLAAYGEGSLDAGSVHQAKSKLEMFRGRYRAGLEEADRAVAIFEEKLGPSHQRLGEAIMAVGVLRFMDGDVRGALTAYQRALVILESALGPEHVDVGLLRSNLGEALLAAGELDDAEAELGRALVIMEKGWGADHPELAFPLKGLGLARLAAGRASDAIVAFERALSVRGGVGDPAEQAEIEWGLARALAKKGAPGARTRASAALARYRGLGAEWAERTKEIEAWLTRTR